MQYHAEAVGGEGRTNAFINSKQNDIYIEQDGSHDDHHIQIGTGKLHNSVKEKLEQWMMVQK